MNGIGSLLVPPPGATALVRTCLGVGGSARPGSDVDIPALIPPTAATAYPLLLPLLAEADAAASLPLPPEIRTLARAARLREQRRHRTVSGICATAFHALNTSGIPFVVAGGVAAAEDAYPDPALRHCHDCDLLLRREDQEDAVHVLADHGFASGVVALRLRAASRVLSHASGFPLILHARRPDGSDVTNRGNGAPPRDRPRTICGVRVHTTAPEELLLHRLSRASMRRRSDNLLWATDGWMIVARARDEIDWERFTTRAGDGDPVVAVAALATWLAKDAGAPIPEAVLAALANAARTADLRRQRLAVAAARTAARGTIPAIVIHARGWRERAAVAERMAGSAWRRLRRKTGGTAAADADPGGHGPGTETTREP